MNPRVTVVIILVALATVVQICPLQAWPMAQRGGRGPVPSEEDAVNMEEAPVEEVPTEGDDEDDTVVIEAASCGQLLQECKEASDIYSCQTYNENCQDEEDSMGEDTPEETFLCAVLPQNCPK